MNHMVTFFVCLYHSLIVTTFENKVIKLKMSHFVITLRLVYEHQISSLMSGCFFPFSNVFQSKLDSHCEGGQDLAGLPSGMYRLE